MAHYGNTIYDIGDHEAWWLQDCPGPVPARVHERYMYVHICTNIYMYKSYVYVYVLSVNKKSEGVFLGCF